MKVVLFCGGFGMRMREYSESVPKPLVNIANRPILWHIMKYYAHYGHKDFILCLGWKANTIKQYFLQYDECISNDFVLTSGGRSVELLSSDIDDWLGAELAVVRVMPNQPAMLLQGVSGLFANDLTTAEQRNQATEIISAVGSVVHVHDEDSIDAVTAISGTGPAYFYFLIDMMIRSAEEFGLDSQAAHKLVMDTAKGSAALAAVSGETMAAMIEHVRSPGGTTAAAFDVFDEESVREIFSRAFTAARDRAVLLAGSSSE